MAAFEAYSLDRFLAIHHCLGLHFTRWLPLKAARPTLPTCPRPVKTGCSGFRSSMEFCAIPQGDRSLAPLPGPSRLSCREHNGVRGTGWVLNERTPNPNEFWLWDLRVRPPEWASGSPRSMGDTTGTASLTQTGLRNGSVDGPERYWARLQPQRPQGEDED